MENETKTQSKGLKVLKAIGNTLINILIVIVLITSLLIAVMALTSKNNGISTMFGYTIQTIQSDSMLGGSPDGYKSGDFGHGDLMIAKATSGKLDDEYHLGDIVTFSEEDYEGNKVLVVHRIVDVVENNQGYKVYQTWGDNREMSQAPDQLEEYQFLPASAFLSVYYTEGYEGKIFKGVGNVLDYLRSQQGFFLVVLLPMIIFFMYELVRVVLNMSSYRKAKSEEEKEEAVKKALSESNAGIENFTPEQMEQFKKFIESQNKQSDADSGSEQDKSSS